MAHFKRVRSLDDLKKQYRTLALENHPDKGGDIEAMKAINAEYDVLFSMWKGRYNASNPDNPIKESATQSRHGFYTEYGWAGKNYSPSLTTKEITARIRSYVKRAYPAWKFSVSFSSYTGGASISVCLMEAPTDIFNRAEIARLVANETACGCQNAKNLQEKIEQEEINIQLNRYWFEREKPYLTRRGYQVLSDVIDFINSYRRDDSDAMVDYFDTNFYYSIGIGKWNKGLKIVPKDDIDFTIQAA